MFNLNRITLIGNTGGDPKVTPNGPTTLSLATNVTWGSGSIRAEIYSRR
jgi:hypothetical protein